jgi:hypothetical protein
MYYFCSAITAPAASGKTMYIKTMYCNLVFVLLLSVSGWAGLRAGLASDIEVFTGGRTKIVWARGVTANVDNDIATKNYKLMGFDTREGQERVIVPGPISCADPWITSDGQRVIFSSWPDTIVYIADWSGQNVRPLLKGFGLCIWNDPATNLDWVYFSEVPYGSRVYRCEIDSINHAELVWNKSPVSIRFRVSADGKQAGGEFPWPNAGEVSLPNGSFTRYGSGCNAQMAPDNSYRFFHLESGHQEITMYDYGGANSRIIRLDTVPGDTQKTTVWIPKWSNDSRFFTVEIEKNQDIYMGKFSGDFSAVQEWLRITNNSYFDDYAYAWIGLASEMMFSHDSLCFTLDAAGQGVLSRIDSVTNFHGTLPPLSAVTQAPWLTLQVDGQFNSQSITNTVSPKGLASGIYSTSVMVSGAGVPSEQYVVTLRIDGPVRLASIDIVPPYPELPCSLSVKFSAHTYDQFHDPMAAPIQWRCDSGGTVSDSGLFQSNGTEGRFTVFACDSGPGLPCASTPVTVYKNLTVISPDSGMVFHSGDTMRIRWQGKPPFLQGVNIFITIDKGRIWIPVNSVVISILDNTWGDFAWVVPDSIDAGNGMHDLKSDSCRVQVADYNKGSNHVYFSRGYFTIAGSSAVRRHPAAAAVRYVKMRVTGRQIRVLASNPIQSLSVYDCKGAFVARYLAPDNQKVKEMKLTCPSGFHLIKVATADGIRVFRCIVY